MEHQSEENNNDELTFIDRDDEVRVSPPPVPQFIIGGNQPIAHGARKDTGQNQEKDELVHPLQRLQPDAWNNIPICLVKAVKVLIESDIAIDQKLRQANSNVDSGIRKLTTQCAKITQEMAKNHEQLRQLIGQTDKHLSAAMTAKDQELETLCMTLKDQQHDISALAHRHFTILSDRFDRIMTPDQMKAHIEHILDEEFGKIRHEFKADFFRLKSSVDGIISMFEIPGIIGENALYPNVTEFLKQTYKQTTEGFDKINEKLYSIENKQLKDVSSQITKISGIVDTLSSNFDQGFKKQQSSLEADLLVITTSIQEHASKMQGINSTLTDRLHSSDQFQASLKAELQVKQSLIDSLRADLISLRADLEEERQNLKSLGSEFNTCQQKVTKIDRAQASQQQISMASFTDGRSAMESRGGASRGKGGAEANAEIERFRARLQDIEKILMEKKMTKKKLGDPEGDAQAARGAASSASNVGGGGGGGAKADAQWTAKIESKLNKLNNTVKSLNNKLSDALKNKIQQSVHPAHGAVGRSQSVLDGGSMQSFKLGQAPPLPDGTPESSAYNGVSRRVGIATATGYQRKGAYNDSQNDSQGTLEDESNFAKFADKRRSVSPPDGRPGQGAGSNGSAGGGNRRSESTSIDQKTTQQMQRLQQLINQTAAGGGGSSKKKQLRQQSPTAPLEEDNQYFMQTSLNTATQYQSPRLGGVLENMTQKINVGILNETLMNHSRIKSGTGGGSSTQNNRTEVGQTSLEDTQRTMIEKLAKGRQHSQQTPHSQTPELQLATFSQTKPLYTINEEAMMMREQYVNRGTGLANTVLPPVEIKRPKLKVSQQGTASYMLNEEMQQIIRNGQFISQFNGRRIPSSSHCPTRKHSPTNPISVKFENITHINGTQAIIPTTVAASITTTAVRR